MHKKAILILLLFCLFIPDSAPAVTVSIPDMSSYEGETIAVPVNMDHAVGLGGFQMVITYDTSALQPAGTGAVSGGFSPSPPWMIDVDISTPGQIVIVAHETTMTGLHMGGGSMVKLTFNVIETQTNTASIDISSIKLSDIYGQEIPVDNVIISGSLNVNFVDNDADGKWDNADNCPYTYNPNQENGDGDSLGDACDICAGAPIKISQTGIEYSSINDAYQSADNNETIMVQKETLYESLEADIDKFVTIEGGYNCGFTAYESDTTIRGEIYSPNSYLYLKTMYIRKFLNRPVDCSDPSSNDLPDWDGDNIVDACDACPDDNDTNCDSDTDQDGMKDSYEIKYGLSRADPYDKDDDPDGDGFTNLEESEMKTDPHLADSDLDGVPDYLDKCPEDYDPLQADMDNDGQGDKCDDIDDDGVIDFYDNCPADPNPSQENTDTPDDLISYWTFDEMSGDSAHDIMNHNDGAVYGAALTAGQTGNALSFNGVDNYVDMGVVPENLQIQDRITLEAWIYIAEYPAAGGLGTIISAQNDSDLSGYALHLDDAGRIIIRMGDGTRHSTNTGTAVPTGEWVHITATRNLNEDGNVYFNGTPQPSTSDAWVGSITYTNAELTIGRQSDGNYFKGLIDEVAIYDRALSVTEIQQHHADGLVYLGYGDNVGDVCDNCSAEPNHDQADMNDDNEGDVCDDTDGDTKMDFYDNCPKIANPGWADNDGDGVGNACDNCSLHNPDQADIDNDAIGDICDTCVDQDQDDYGDPAYPNTTCPNGNHDNCPEISNSSQADIDADGKGDVCDPCTDTDKDGFGNPGYPANTCDVDLCPDVPNTDPDGDFDGIVDECDACTDTDGDGYGDPGYPLNACLIDNCPDDPNGQSDSDGDGIGDECDICSAVLPIEMNGAYYSSLQTAYNAAPDNAEIKVQSETLNQNLLANIDKTVTIKGGHQCDFVDPPTGTTIIEGEIANVDSPLHLDALHIKSTFYSNLICSDVSGFEMQDTDNDGIVDVCDPCPDDDTLNCDRDLDGDGMSDSYEIQYGLNRSDPKDADMDMDGDGLTNFQEVRFGSDPNDPGNTTCLPVWTDDPIIPQQTLIKAVHFSELRNSINILRSINSLQPYSWTNPAPVPYSMEVTAVEIIELRDAIDDVAGPQNWAEDTVIVPQVTPIKAIHIEELRQKVSGECN